MTAGSTKKTSSGLRQRAERAVKKAGPRAELSERDLSRLVHELQVHQVELQMQNEELSRAHGEIEEARDRYEELYEYAPVGYVTLDPQGTIVQANLTAATLLGVPRGQLVGRPLATWCVPPTGDALHLHCRALFDTGEPQTGLIRVQRDDGSVVSLRIDSRAAEGGQTCLTVFIDVSERESTKAELLRARAELEERVLARTAELTRLNEALTDSEERFRLLAENAYDVVFRYRVRPEPGFEYISPSISMLTGYPPEDFYDDPELTIELTVEADRDRLLKALAGYADLGEPVEFRFVDREGVRRWAEMRTSGVYDQNGRVVAVEGISRDVTDRKRAEEALRQAHDELEQRVLERTRSLVQANEALIDEITKRRRVEEEHRDSEAKIRSIVETAVDGILSIDEHGVIESFNAAAETIFGYTADEVVGQSVDILLAQPSEASNEVPPPPGGETSRIEVIGHEGELTGRRKNGTTFPMELGVGEVKEGPLRHIWVVRDVSERRRLEAELRHSQKMQAIGTLASGIAHDFNNLLQGIIGCADLALGRLSDDSPARRYVGELKSASISGAGVVAQLMEFSHRREGKPRVVDLNRLVTGRETLLKRLVGEDVQLQVNLCAEPAPMRCDPAQLEQVLMNLVVNARHAMPRGGRLEIATGQAEFSALGAAPGGLEPGRYVTLTVHDTGHGMDEATRQRVFEPFFTTKGVGKGTGLGLSGVYAIVTGAGGHIDLDSEVGHGATFTLYFPRSDEPIQMPSEIPDAAAESGHETLLVVEDQPLVLASVRYYLEQHGYRVLTAASKAEADRVLEQLDEPIHLLLTDVVLSDGEGPAVAEAARKKQPDLTVLYMSAFSRDLLVERNRLETEAAPLQKPFTASELISRVRAALRECPAGGGPQSDALSTPRLPNVVPLFRQLPAASAPEAAEAPAAPARQLSVGDAAVPSRQRSLSEARSPRRRPDTARRARVLLVEDEDLARMAGHELLEDHGYDVTEAASAEAALEIWRAESAAFDVVVTDVGLPDMSGIDLLEHLRTDRPELGAVLISGRAAYDPVFDAIRDQPKTAFLEKPVELSRVVGQIEAVLG